MAYNYRTNSNQLLNVIDAANLPTTKLGDFRTSTLHPVQSKTATTVDYTYDVNGNLKKDLNKDIGTSSVEDIVYNHLNLPQSITVRKAAGAVKGVITYTYDAAGNKIKKEVAETGFPTKTTLYHGNGVYENDVLQFLGHEEGRVRFKPLNGSVPASLQYDYMLKDHLGNIRMVLTEEQQTDKYPVASMEDTKLATEQLYYTVDNTKIVLGSTVSGLPAYTNDNGIGNNPADATFEQANSQKLYRLNSTTNKTGLGIALKVMAGDKLDIFGKSFYNQPNAGGSGVNSAIPVLDIINGLMGSPGGATAGGHTTSGELMTVGGVTSGVSGFISDPQRDQLGSDTKPKAYINYILLDEQFKFVSGNFSQAGTQGQLKSHYGDAQMQNIAVNKNGYVYVFVSNESPVNVYFDNLQVVHTRGAILEETHYYPFGLTIAGISSKALAFGSPENKRKWNKGSELESKEFSDGSGLELYSTFYRSLDPQLGRFWQIDPKPNYEQSLYSSMGNNPINFNDPLGDTLRGSSNQDGRRLQRMIRQTFRGKEMKAVRQMFQRRLYVGDKKTFAAIREGQVNQATANLSADQKSLVKGYIDAINSTQVHTVETARRGETLKDANSVINIGGTMTRTGRDVDAAAGGGFNIPTATGTHSVIVMNSSANIPDYRDNNTGNLVPGMTSSRGELLAHELLGHGLTRFNAGGSQFLNAIQLTNLYHRATGNGNLYRDGTSHGGTTGVPLTYPQASAVPLYLQ